MSESLESIRELQDKLRNGDENQAESILSILSGLNITFDQLKETKIPKTVKRVEKKYPKLRLTTRKLIDQWKRVVKERKRAEAIPTHVEEYRDRTIKLFTEILNSNELATGIEKSLFNTIDKNDYTKKARSLLFNLKKNSGLKQRVLSQEISPDELVKMNPKDMATEERKIEREKLEQELTEGRRSDWNAVNNAPKNGMFKCKRCGSNSTTNTQMQTRSADEPMTT